MKISYGTKSIAKVCECFQKQRNKGDKMYWKKEY